MKTRSALLIMVLGLAAALPLLAQNPVEKFSLNVVSPDGGEQWLEGSTHKISWRLEAATTPDSIYIRLISPSNWKSRGKLLAALGKDNKGSWKWHKVGPAGQGYLVEITAVFGKETVTSTSIKTFSIVSLKPVKPEPIELSLVVISPNGGEKWAIGSQQVIRWHTERNDALLGEAVTFTILLSSDGGKTFPIALVSDLHGPAAQWAWLVNGPPSHHSQIKLLAKAGITSPEFLEDTSDADFVIAE